MAGEVHEDVDLVSAHQLRQVSLAQGQHLAPEAAGSFHGAPQPRRFGVRARHAAVDNVPYPAWSRKVTYILPSQVSTYLSNTCQGEKTLRTDAPSDFLW